MKNAFRSSALLTMALAIVAGCDSSAGSMDSGESYVSMGQLFQASSTNRALTAHERSYLLGAAHGVFAYVAYQQMNGRADHAYVCVTPIQMGSVTPEWLHATMIKDVTDEPLWSTQDSTDAAITAANTLAKHFPCKNAPAYNPEGFDDALDFIQQSREPSPDNGR